METIIKKAYETHDLNREELIEILKNDDCNKLLFAAADKIRKEYVGDEIHLRGLIEFSNICKNNCLYCGLRRDNHKITRYRIQPQEIIELAKYACDLGLRTVVLQSGEDLYYTTEMLEEICSGIKALGLAITLSIGEKSFEEYAAYKKAGADRYLLRIETTDKQIYAENDPGMSWENRLECLKNIKACGYEVGSGCLVGLPGQSIESLADDILFFKEIDADMIGIGPFIPHPDTPLKKSGGGSLILALKVMALTRLLLPRINIPATTAMETLAPNGQIMALQSGANVIMPNITLESYRKNYQLYPGKTTAGYSTLDKIYEKAESIGRTISSGFGISQNWIRRNENGRPDEQK